MLHLISMSSEFAVCAARTPFNTAFLCWISPYWALLVFFHVQIWNHRTESLRLVAVGTTQTNQKPPSRYAHRVLLRREGSAFLFSWFSRTIEFVFRGGGMCGLKFSHFVSVMLIKKFMIQLWNLISSVKQLHISFQDIRFFFAALKSLCCAVKDYN